MYWFLLRPAWLGRLAAALALAAVMSLLGLWQLDRFEQRSAINERIDAAEADTAVPLPQLVPAPGPGQEVGPAPPEQAGWAMATVTGRYDPAHQVLVRGRTVSGRVGFEVLTPLVLADGSAVLVDRGWVAAAGDGAAARPELPAAPDGQVSVVGRVRPSESGSRLVERRDGVLETRRIDLTALAPHLPYPLHGGYLLLESQQPPGEAGLTTIPPRRENSWLNAGYAVQWWLFAALVLVGFGWLARRERSRLARPQPGPSGEESGVISGPSSGMRQ